MVTALLAYPNTSKLRLAALLILQGCLIEVLQFFSGYRFGEWRDAAADALGVFLRLGLGALLKKLFLKHLQSV
jgi:VanZ family protein